MLLADFVFLLMALKTETLDERSDWLFFYFIVGGFLVFDLFALSTVGMWLGLSGRKTNRATIVGLMRIIVLPSAAFTLIGIIAAIVSVHDDSSLTGFAILWIALSTVTNLVFMSSANNHLRQFRDIVAQRFSKLIDERPVSATKAPSKMATPEVSPT
jgi:hypothetical protein